MQTLTAAAVAAWTGDGYAALAIAESKRRPTWGLVIQRALDGAGRVITHEPTSLSNTLGATHYGGISRWAVQRDTLELLLTDDAAATLGLPPASAMRLPSPDVAQQVASALAWLITPASPAPPDVFRRTI